MGTAQKWRLDRARLAVRCGMVVGGLWLGTGSAGIGHALGQCEATWQTGEGVAGVVSDANSYPDDRVRASVTWDPDGPEPTPELLVVAGAFSVAGDRAAKNAATWDGASWSPLGELAFPAWAVVVDDGDLFVASCPDPVPYPSTPEPYVLRWTGLDWAPVGGIGQSNTVYALHVHEGDLIAGGRFVKCDDLVVNGIARWDGGAWHAIGSGIFSKEGPFVRAIASYGGQIIAGGLFNSKSPAVGEHIARWDGASWQPMAGGFDGPVRCLTISNGDLIAGGDFWHSGVVALPRIARWNGLEWVAIGELKALTTVRSVAHYQGKLLASAEFNYDNPPILKQWDGKAWSNVGGNAWGYDPGIRTMTEYQGKLIAGGAVRYCGNPHQGGYTTVKVESIAAWDDATQAWSAMPGGLLESWPVKGSLDVVASYGGGIAMAGYVYDFKGPSGYRVVHWSGGKPSDAVPLGGRFNYFVRSLVEHESGLVAGGEFDSCDDKRTGGVAIWDGESWVQLGDGLQGTVASLHSTGEDLIAGGQFSWPIVGLYGPTARFDGTTWTPLGSGLTSSYVSLVGSHLGKPVAVRSSIDPVLGPVTSVVMLQGDAWTQLGASMTVNSLARSIRSFDGQLYVGGSLVIGNKPMGIAHWDGLAWVGVGTPYPLECLDLNVWNDSLIAMSRYTVQSIGPAKIERLTAGAWQPIVTEGVGEGGRLVPWKNELIVTGNVSTPDGHYYASLNRLACVCRSDCDNSGLLDVDDFVCFQTLYAVGDPRADCDGNGALAVEDFVCFQVAYAVGC